MRKPTKADAIPDLMHEMLKDPSAQSVTYRDIVEYYEETKKESIDDDTVRRALRKLYTYQQIEYKDTCRGRSYRFVGSPNPFPLDYNEIILDILKKLNDKTGGPITMSELMDGLSASGHVLERARVYERVMKLAHRKAKILIIGEASGRCNTKKYLINSAGTKDPVSMVHKKYPVVHKDPRPYREIFVEKYGGYLTEDLDNAKTRTHVGDPFDIIIRPKTGWREPDYMQTKRVKVIGKNICIFEDGTSLPWIDLAMYYGTGKTLEMEKC